MTKENITRLLEIAERCEKASEGSRELDGDIAAAFRLYPHDWRRGSKDASADAIWFDDEHRTSWRAPDFTTSLDAVLTLLPEGWWWSAGVCRRENHASVGSEIGTVEGELIFETFGATAPLALLSAILRARQAMQMEVHHER